MVFTMKARIAFGLVASLALLASAEAEAGPKKRRGHEDHGSTRTASVVAPAEKASSDAASSNKAARGSATADKASPNKPVADKRSPDKPAADKASPDKPVADKHPVSGSARRISTTKAPAKSRFLSSGVPLAEVREGRIKGVATSKRPCGLRNDWAKIGSLWSPLDAWGQPLSKTDSRVTDRKLYEGSGCYEVDLQASKDSPETARLYVAKGSGYSPAPSAKWSPDAKSAKGFEQLYASQATAWVDAKPESAAEHGKVLFFHLPKQESSPEGAPTQRRPIHWAVTGGRVLLVGYVGQTGAWKVGQVLPPNGKDHAYEPIAVLDMNGDGLPEIVVHEEAGGVFTDRVLSFDAGAMRWEKAVESPGGASR